jgi:murein DD-endopeptidase MepM/ murein hydrolase activator NlpD
MKLNVWRILMSGVLIVMMSAFTPAKNKFSNLETQQISVATPGLFSRSKVFNVDFSALRNNEYSFPLPVGKAEKKSNDEVEITTSKGDAVKSMFDGVVRLSRNYPSNGNVIVVRHDNGLETVYADNAQNMVDVGQRVKAGQTIAIVGGSNGRAYCTFSIMVNGGRINPDIILDLRSHRLRKQVLLCENKNSYVDVSVISADMADKYEAKEIQPKSKNSLASLTDGDKSVTQLNLSNFAKEEWCYPLPGSHVISPYGGARHHAGVDIKTRPNDKIYAAFDGVVKSSGPYFGYGNFIVIKHDNGLETRYSHQSRNFVKAGDHVKAGQVIGLTGRTGRATTEHLHFEVAFNGRRIDPAMVFDHLNKSLQQSTLTYNKGVVRSQKNYYAQGR